MIRWVPLDRVRRPLAWALGAGPDPDQVNAVVQTITASLSPELAQAYAGDGRSLWRDHLSPAERASFCEMAVPHHDIVRRITPRDVWESIARARPDLARTLDTPAGRAWLAAQTTEIRVALLAYRA